MINNNFRKILIININDLLIYLLSFILSGVIASDMLDFKYINDFKNSYLLFFFGFFAYLLIFQYFQVYNIIIRRIDINSLKNIIYALLIYSFIFLCTAIFLTNVRISIGILQPLIFSIIILLSRVTAQHLLIKISEKKNEVKKVLIYGAGDAGNQILSLFDKNPIYEVVGFIDDDIIKQNRTISNIKIHPFNNVKKITEKFDVQEIIIAIPSINSDRKMIILEKLGELNIKVQTLPKINDIINNTVNYEDIKPININDLLERKINLKSNEYFDFSNDVILITGAGGSIGSELYRQIRELCPRKLIAVDNSEYNLYKITKDSKNDNNIHLLASIQDTSSLENIFKKYKPTIVFHAAAYKHVNIVEVNIAEAAKNNILGTSNLVKVSIQFNVEKFIFISTDKAVRPTNIMGATKRVAELCVQSHSHNLNKFNTNFSIIRFGNVLGSSGSVVPLFYEQILKKEKITVTSEKVTRYFMTVLEAVNLILQSIKISKGGEIFILDMGEPVKIIDLAKKMISLSGMTERNNDNPKGDIEIKIIGLKPGEKLFEELVINQDSIQSKNSNIFIANEKSISSEEYKLLEEKIKKFISHEDTLGLLSIFENYVSGFNITEMHKISNKTER